MTHRNVLPSSGKGLIIHHWDTDGICSAAILLEFIENTKIWSPQIGNYYLTQEEIRELSANDYDFIIVADMAIPENNILELKRESRAEIYIFDHHLQELIKGVNHYNPVSMGLPPEKYPSNSWSLTEYLKRDIDLLSILGAVGDNGSRIKDNQAVYGSIESFIKNSNLSFEDLLTMVELIDSNYKTGNREMILNAVHFIKENQSSPEVLLNNGEWQQNVKDLESELNSQGNMPVSLINGISVQEINTKYNIISALTRQLAWNSGSKVSIVVNKGFFDENDQIYIRAGSTDVILKPVIELACENGFSAGGKKEVAGIVLPKEHTDNFIAEIIMILKIANKKME